MLLIREHAEVVNHLESQSLVTTLTNLWLSDFSSLNELVLFLVTLGAFEACFLHLRNGVTSSDYNTLQSD